MRKFLPWVRQAPVIFFVVSGGVFAADAIQVGALTTDPPTICCLGLAVSVSGDDDYDAVAQLEYRKLGDVDWLAGLPLLRVRPETTSTETPPGNFGLPRPGMEFAGSVFDLDPDTAYEIRVTVTDPDGGGTTQTVTAATRPVPRSMPATARPVAVANGAELTDALANAQPGDVISLAAGSYPGGISIARAGSSVNPIVIRGERRDGVIIDAPGSTSGVQILGDHVHLENLTVSGSNRGVDASGVEGMVIRNVRFTDVDMGVVLLNGTNRDAYICDNVLEGRHLWPDVSNRTWDSEGIVVTGQGHVICHNTLSGFGDALGLSFRTDIRNISIDVYGNDVLWTGDDGIEFDYAHRNVRGFRNRITNAGMGVSLQPMWGGPVYIVKNVFVNTAKSPFKFNDEPSGFLVFNNTSIRTLADDGQGTFDNFRSYAFGHPGYQVNGHRNYVSNFQMKNNLMIGLTGPVRVGSDFNLADIDYNGWSPDGEFVFYEEAVGANVSYTGIADLRSRTSYAANGIILTTSTFEVPPNMPPDHTTLVAPVDVTLHQNSNAIDAALLLPNTNADFLGAGPDIGAWERGQPIPSYGVRQAEARRPAAPTGLAVE